MKRSTYEMQMKWSRPDFGMLSSGILEIYGLDEAGETLFQVDLQRATEGVGRMDHKYSTALGWLLNDEKLNHVRKLSIDPSWNTYGRSLPPLRPWAAIGTAWPQLEELHIVGTDVEGFFYALEHEIGLDYRNLSALGLHKLPVDCNHLGRFLARREELGWPIETLGLYGVKPLPTGFNPQSLELNVERLLIDDASEDEEMP